MSEKIEEVTYQFVDQKIRYLCLIVAIVLFVGQFLEFNFPDIGQSFTKEDMFSTKSSGIFLCLFIITKFVKRMVSEKGLSYVIFGYKTPVIVWKKFKFIERTESALFLETIVRSSDSSDDKVTLWICKIGENNADLIEKKLGKSEFD